MIIIQCLEVIEIFALLAVWLMAWRRMMKADPAPVSECGDSPFSRDYFSKS